MSDESDGRSDATDEIMDGVYRALCTHGYADLTMRDIADECSKSKSLLHYHYDTKEDLLVAFLDHILSGFEAWVDEGADRSPARRIVEFVGWFVFEPAETDREAFHIALLELRSQGPFNDRIRERLLRSDRLLRGTVADILTDGIEAGVFRDVDVEETAALLVATLDGARTRQITLDTGLGATGTDDDTADRGRRDDADHDAPGSSSVAGSGIDGGVPDVLEGAYTRTVAEATLQRVVDPLLVEGETRPSLAETLDTLSARTGQNPAAGNGGRNRGMVESGGAGQADGTDQANGTDPADGTDQANGTDPADGTEGADRTDGTNRTGGGGT